MNSQYLDGRWFAIVFVMTDDDIVGFWPFNYFWALIPDDNKNLQKLNW